MYGIPLSTFQLDLHKIDLDCENPARTILDWQQKIQPVMDKIVDYYDDNFNFPKEYHRLPLKLLVGFSFDELCKLYHSSIIMMNSTVNDLFETNPQYEIVRKIANSIWRWSLSRAMWNEIVDGYNNIRNFTFINDPHFEIRLDHTRYFHERGWSKYGTIFLDGVFAFLVYYKGVHVFTIGFSIGSNRQLLIQQVQLTKRSGNRWLYKLPKNRLEFVLDRFRECFTDYTINVIDGGALAERNLRDYRCGLQRKEEWLQRPDSLSAYELASIQEERAELQEKIAHLEGDKPRLANFYKDVGSYQIDATPVMAMGMPHYPVVRT